MNVVVLAGGMGTRLHEETVSRPKPMVEIGGKPILWHLMKHYSQHGFCNFHIALGYLGSSIKQYFLDCYSLSGNLTIDFGRRKMMREETVVEDWVVNLVDTGQLTNTGGRLKRLQRWLSRDTFMLTYGDGVSNVDLTALLDFHRRSGKLVTITAVRPPARFGGLLLNEGVVERFTEKPQAGEGWINGGFMVCEPSLFDYLSDDNCSLEINALDQLATEGKLAAYRHQDFWQCMDTLRDKKYLEKLWETGNAAWKTWDSAPNGSQDMCPSTVDFPEHKPVAA